jgi:hypothetical protein
MASPALTRRPITRAVFQDEDTEVLRVSADDVRSVVRTNMPDEEHT